MAHNILVRNIPDEVKDWIEKERHKQLKSKQEFLLDTLSEAAGYNQTDLFNREYPGREFVNNKLPFTFIDLFAGIGGFRLGLQRAGGECVFTSEWDKYAQKTYLEWFGDVPHGDIRELDPTKIPDHDVLAAGFPCQPFSIAGVSKKKSLGREHGFKDKTQGTMFFYLATIIEIKRPPVLILENVKNLVSHDKGRTWDIIKATLEDLGYKLFHQIIDAKNYVPQHRERVFIVCFDKKIFGENPPFTFPEPPNGPTPKLADILETEPDKKYTLSDHLWNYLQEYAERQKKKGNGFGFGLVDVNGISRTLSARYYKDGSEILIPDSDDLNPRRLTPRECARLMGFDDHLPIVVSDTQAYRQFGNALCPKVAEEVGNQVVETMLWYIEERRNGCLIKASSAR